ncbi:hypothetical protein CROQUDRAFT_683127 [Cronartium quercuum f. sp. fusiforme G11]|uniref:Uncharacterized protein n=1 Tax=Cronartium quercuum f. sp. fusiforme G11 TaxID=708437 RepID=A0A9P6NEC2_9BASI|nr:hypothetical protein CROQUDRAFT_683127 [Cronartium quercuum f. sp. fusiforme G11]
MSSTGNVPKSCVEGTPLPNIPHGGIRSGGSVGYRMSVAQRKGNGTGDNSVGDSTVRSSLFSIDESDSVCGSGGNVSGGIDSGSLWLVLGPACGESSVGGN